MLPAFLSVFTEFRSAITMAQDSMEGHVMEDGILIDQGQFWCGSTSPISEFMAHEIHDLTDFVVAEVFGEETGQV